MHKIFTLLFCALITTFHPSAKASAPSTDDEAYAAAARPSDGPDFLSALPDKKGSITTIMNENIKAISESIVWPDDISEDDRFYCAERIIALELNLWEDEPAPHIISEVVAQALANTLSLKTLIDEYRLSLDRADGIEKPHTKLLALAIILDQNPSIDVNELFLVVLTPLPLILNFVVEYGTPPFIGMLLKRGALFGLRQNDSLPVKAIRKNNMGTLKELIEWGANLDQPHTWKNLTPLHIAVMHKNLQAVKLLLLSENSANPYYPNRDNKNTLEFAEELQERDPCSLRAEIIDYLKTIMATPRFLALQLYYKSVTENTNHRRMMASENMEMQRRAGASSKS